jgi:hypothetical protein
MPFDIQSLSIQAMTNAMQDRWYYFLLAGSVILLGRSIASVRRRRQMPPGPSGIPILGNALQIPVSMPWYRFTELSKEYGTLLFLKMYYVLVHIGPIFSLNMAGQPVVVLNSHKITADLFGLLLCLLSGSPA